VEGGRSQQTLIGGAVADLLVEFTVDILEKVRGGAVRSCHVTEQDAEDSTEYSLDRSVLVCDEGNNL
jgi:hypothetical protein